MGSVMTWGDLFAGGGGTTEGALQVPGVKVLFALNHSDVAIATHSANHPETVHYKEDIRLQNVKVLPKVDGLWASLECTNFSNAKGGKPRDADSRSLAWELPRYTIHCQPDIIVIENVKEFMSWGPLDEKGKPVSKLAGSEYVKWVEYMKNMGYPYFDWKILNSADYGAHTSRRRFFAVFSKFEYHWPAPTHFKDGINGHKWKACKEKIDLSNEGNSIFGRELNEKIRKPHRKPLSNNTLRRIAGGLKKFAPDMYYLMCYYGNGTNCHSINAPAPVITSRGDGKDGIALIKAEKLQFITDHCQCDYQHGIEQPLPTQLTRQTKQLISVDKKFITKYYGDKRPNGNRQIHAADLDQPYPTIKTVDSNALISAKFISPTFNSNGNPEANNKSIDEPLNAVLTREKFQFISAYFNSNGKPESQNQSIDKPLNTVLTAQNKKSFITAYYGRDDAHQDIEDPLNTITTANRHALTTIYFDFDIKMRFLTAKELADITGFREGYEFKGNTKQVIWQIGNAVPPVLSKVLIEESVKILVTT
ncbi:MAG: DNA cytosine methyltransferase [Bacteroidales bacterium]